MVLGTSSVSSSSSSSSSTSSVSPACSGSTTPDLEDTLDPLEVSAYFKRLHARGTHKDARIKAITAAGKCAVPPTEPPAWLCCASSCGIDCVVTMWWEEERVWRDCHEDWKDIKQRLKEEEEDRLRAEEEERELNGPVVDIMVDDVSQKLETTKL